ncbi:MAG: hypothetical protein D6731_24655 [Planctomycetota bacterium]|nr:MAG: hypothetical protein D6731_24655 [Planctomycetota bacterium]
MPGDDGVPRPAGGRRRRRRRFAAFALALGVACACLIGELGLRVLGVVAEPRRHFRPGILRADPELGWALRPNYRGVRYEYAHQAATSTDSLGYRGPEWTAARARAPLRVLCLGDSVTFGIGVADEETYPAQLESLLRGRGQAASVYDAGVPGYDTVQEAVVYQRLAARIHPQVVVLAWLPNDLAEPSQELRKQVRFIDGHMIHDERKYRRWKRRVEHRGLYASALYRFFRVRSQNLIEALRRREPPPRIEPKPLDYSLRPLEAIARRAREDGAHLVVVLVPTREQVAGREPIAQHERMGAAARELGAEVVDLAAAWAGKPRAGRFLLRDRLHFTPSGCAEIAEAVARTAALAPAR